MSSRLFNGSSYIDCGNVTQLVSATAFTLVFCCFKSSPAQKTMITKGSAANRLLCERWSDGIWYLWINSSTTTLADFTVGWHWYAMTFDASMPSGSRARFYRGRTLLATWCTATSVSSVTDPLVIGRDPVSGGTNNDSGTMFSHVQLYSRALDRGTGNELFNLMIRPWDRPLGCVGYWSQGPLTGIAERDAQQNYQAAWVGTPQHGTSTPPYIMNQAEVPNYGVGVA